MIEIVSGSVGLIALIAVVVIYACVLGRAAYEVEESVKLRREIGEDRTRWRQEDEERNLD